MFCRMSRLSNDEFIIAAHAKRYVKTTSGVKGKRIFHNEYVKHQYQLHMENVQCILYNITTFKTKHNHCVRI